MATANFRFLGILLLLTAFLINSTFSQISPAALKDWKDQKFSMFIHWGIYSELGGVWQGKEISRGLSEQIQAHAGIYSDSYANVAKKFNPKAWNADSIALLAKNAGMRSVIFTSKHHDGFAMFDTKVSNFDIVDATPFKRDVLAELAAACKRHGLKFGLYFSLIDWHYPQASPISSHNSDYITPEHHEFNKKQITELLTNYGAISELWFDMGSQTYEQSHEMRDLVHKLQPDCMIGSRIGNDMGDFTVMSDNQEPTYIIDVPWQSPASFFHETWGYRSWQKRTDAEQKFREKLTSLIKVVSRGGNYLLNIGPRGDGSVVEYEKDILLKMGDWLTKNKEAIYETETDPYHETFPWGSITSRKNKLYLHVLQKPANNQLVLPRTSGSVTRVSVLGENSALSAKRSGANLVIKLPDDTTFLNSIPVISIEFSNGFSVPPANIIAATQNLELSSDNSFKYFSNSGLDYNTRFQSTIRELWTLTANKNTSIKPSIFYTVEEKGKNIQFTMNGKDHNIALNAGIEVPLKNNPASLKKGTMYYSGPLYSGVEGVHGNITNIDPSKPWPQVKGEVWKKAADGTDHPLTFPAGMMTAYYLLQEIEAPENQQLVIGVTHGEGVIVFLNGEQQFIHLDHQRKDSSVNHVLLNLKKGTNQILVKLFNNFGSRVVSGISFDVPQVLYRQQLPDIHIKKDSYFPILWSLTNPSTPHEDISMQNVFMRME